MELKINADKENKVLGRREISASATYADKTPTRDEIKQELCKKLGLDPDLVEVREIRQQYGLRVSDVSAYSYQSKESMAKLVKYRGKSGAPAQAKSGATAAPAEPAKPAKGA
jgi:ribosomal protein S24E